MVILIKINWLGSLKARFLNDPPKIYRRYTMLLCIDLLLYLLLLYTMGILSYYLICILSSWYLYGSPLNKRETYLKIIKKNQVYTDELLSYPVILM